MKNLRALVALFLIAVFLASSALAQTSAINPAVPAQNSPLSSAAIRAQFAAAIADFNTLWTAITTAISNATNASNLSSGTVPPARLPLASTSTAGAIVCGSGLSCSTSGVASVTGGGVLPLASSTTLGVISCGSGLSCSSTGVASVTNGLPTPGTVAAAQARGLPPNQWSSLVGYGSRDNVYPAYIPAEATFMGLIGSQMNVSPTLNVNGSFGLFGCDDVDDEIFPDANPTISHNPLVIWSPNPRDPTFGSYPSSTFTQHEQDTAACRLAALTWLGIPGKYKVYAQSSSCTTTGTWTPWAGYGGQIGLASTTQGSTISCPLPTTGGPVYPWYEMIGNSGGTFTYNIDGGSNTTLLAQGNNQFTYPLSSSSQAPAAVRALASTSTISHAINFAVTSTTTTGNQVVILGAGAPPPIGYGGGNPIVVATGQPYQAANADASQTAAYDADIKSAVATTFGDGLSTYAVDVRNAICCNYTTDMLASGQNGNPLSYNAAGHQHVAEVINSAIQPQRNPTGAIDPRDYGASCNTQLLTQQDDSSTARGVNTTQGSNIVCPVNYTFQPGFATQDGGGGDIGRVITIATFYGDQEVGPPSYISNVFTSGPNIGCAALDPNWAALQSYSGVYALIGGHPTLPGVASSATDDTQGIEAACAAAASTQGALGWSRIGNSYVQAPDHCMIANLACPGVKIQGNNATNVYSNPNNPGSSATTWYVNSTGFVDSPYLGYDIGHSLHGALKDITIQGITGIGTASYLSCVGSLVNNSLDNESFLLDHVSVFGCQVDAGTPEGWDNPVTINGYISGTTLNVLSITSTNYFATYIIPGPSPGAPFADSLAKGRTLTGTGVPSGETILAPVTSGAAGGVGQYLVSMAATTSTETITSPATAISYSGTMRNSWFGFAQFLWKGDRSDFTETDDILTGGFNYARYIGPYQTSEGNGADRINLGREEECNEFGGAGCDMFDTAITTNVTGQEVQFPGGAAYMFTGTANGISFTGGQIEGAGTCWSASADKAAIRFYGSPTHITFDGVNVTTPNYGTCGGNTYSLFGVTTGATPDYIAFNGGDTTSNYGGTPLAVVWSGAGTIPPHRRIATQGRAYVDTTGAYSISGALNVVTTSLNGGASMFNGLVGTTTNTATETISGLSPTQNYYDCSGKDLSTPGATFAEIAAGTTSTSCALQLTGTANANDVVIFKAVQGN